MQCDAKILLHTTSIRMKGPVNFFLISNRTHKLDFLELDIGVGVCTPETLFTFQRSAHHEVSHACYSYAPRHTIASIQPHGPNLLLNRIQEQPQLDPSLCDLEEGDLPAHCKYLYATRHFWSTHMFRIVLECCNPWYVFSLVRESRSGDISCHVFARPCRYDFSLRTSWRN